MFISGYPALRVLENSVTRLVGYLFNGQCPRPINKGTRILVQLSDKEEVRLTFGRTSKRNAHDFVSCFIIIQNERTINPWPSRNKGHYHGFVWLLFSLFVFGYILPCCLLVASRVSMAGALFPCLCCGYGLLLLGPCDFSVFLFLITWSWALVWVVKSKE